VKRTKYIGKYTSWIVLSVFLMLMAWKCEQGYREYRSLSDGFDSLASACDASDEQPCIIPVHGWDN
jgi:hypothetical protein